MRIALLFPVLTSNGWIPNFERCQCSAKISLNQQKLFIFFLYQALLHCLIFYMTSAGEDYIYIERGVLNQLGNLLQLISGGPPIHMDIVPVRRLI